MSDWIIGNIEPIVDFFLVGFIKLINILIASLGFLIDSSAYALPDFTIPQIASLSDQYKTLQFLCWFFPIDCWISYFTAWIASETAYIVTSPILRWAKLIKG